MLSIEVYGRVPTGLESQGKPGKIKWSWKDSQYKKLVLDFRKKAKQTKVYSCFTK